MTNSYVLTGNSILIHTWLARKGACKLEEKGLVHSSGRSIKAKCRQDLGLKRNAPLNEIVAAIDERCRELASNERSTM